MKKYKYEVFGIQLVYEFVWAFNKQEALILAQAEAISNGKDYKKITVKKVVEATND